MKFDFTTEYDRRGMDALAVDGLGLIPGKSPDRPKKGFDVIPMWIADMSFATVPTVISAMQNDWNIRFSGISCLLKSTTRALFSGMRATIK